MTKFQVWLQGKKTILVAAGTVILTGLGFWYGKLTPAQALQLVSLAGFAVGLGSKLQRYLPQILTGLEGAAAAIADLKAGHTIEAARAVEATAGSLLYMPPDSGLHITGDADHVAAIVDAVTSPGAATFVQAITPRPGSASTGVTA